MTDQKQEHGELDWAIRSPVKAVSVAGRRLTWQPLDKAIRSSDLVIVEQASSLLLNYVLMAGSRIGVGPQVALWGHGVNLQTHAASDLGERLNYFRGRHPEQQYARQCHRVQCRQQRLSVDEVQTGDAEHELH